MATEAKKSLAAKLAEVMAVVKRVEKRGKNEFHGYKYVTEADLADAIRDELSQRGVILVPDVQSIEVTPGTPTKAGRPQFLTTLMVKWTFKDGDSAEEISFQIPGWGIDGEDKGGYKALTGSEKYALMKFFLVPTGDDPERDERPQERPVQNSRTSPARDAGAATTSRQQPPADGLQTFPPPDIMGNEISGTVVTVRRATPKTGKGGEYLQVAMAGHRTMVCFDPTLYADLEAIKKPTPAVLKFAPSTKPGSFPDSVTAIVSINGRQPELERLGIGDKDMAQMSGHPIDNDIPF